jgi:hypothetical protein
MYENNDIRIFLKSGHFSIRICFYHCSMASGSENMCRKKVDTTGLSIEVLRYTFLNSISIEIYKLSFVNFLSFLKEETNNIYDSIVMSFNKFNLTIKNYTRLKHLVKIILI